MSSRELRFPSHDHILSGRLELPEDPPVAVALFAHCFTCGKDIAAASRISRALTMEGIAVLRFDFTGLGNSDGDFANTNFSSNVDDLIAAADFLRRDLEAPSLLVGHSLGGAAVLAAAQRIPEAVAVVTIGAPSKAAHVEHLFGDHIETIEQEGSAEVLLGQRKFRIARQFLEDIRTQETKLRQLNRALLIMHSPIDELVSIDEAAKIYNAAKHPKSFISLDSADHLLTRKTDANYVARSIAAWVSRYLPERKNVPNNTPDIQPKQGQARAESVGNNFLNRISAGTHQLLADEPPKVGGENQGPSPYEFLLAGLAACTSMTVRMYANRKGWPLEKIDVVAEHERVEGVPPTGTIAHNGRYERVTRRIQFHGPLDTPQIEKLLEIADRCPVHRTLESKPEIRTILVKPTSQR